VELWREGRCCVMMVRDGWRGGEWGEEERGMTGPEAMTKYSRDDNIITTTTTQARV
jgi:hypothetical protein